MRVLKTVIAVFLALTVLTSCKPNNSAVDESDKNNSSNASDTSAKAVILPFSSSDVLNPFAAKTKQNQELSMLLFDPLVKVNEDFEADCYIAKKITQDGNNLTVDLNDISFTDGSKLTSEDVIYSLKLAKSCVNYATQLSAVSGYRTNGSNSLYISISHFDPYFVNNLDFPIIKAGTDNLKNENNLAVAPIGCGRYTLTYDGNYSLTANPGYYKKTVKLNRIELVNCPDEDSLSHYMSIGSISMVYSNLSDSQIPKMTGKPFKTASASLVYLGANSQRQIMSDSRMRLAISFGIDREAICSKAYFEYSQPTTSLFPSSWAKINGLKSIDSTQNTTQAVAYLNELGYNKTDGEGYLLDSKDNRISLSLLYNSDNAARTSAAEQIAAQLKKCGLFINTVGLGYDQYKLEIEAGKYDLYIGEIRFSNSLDISSVFDSNGAVFGVQSDSPARSAYLSYESGETDILSAVSGFVSDMPFIPVCYRNGVIIASKTVSRHVKFSISDVYNNIETVS